MWQEAAQKVAESDAFSYRSLLLMGGMTASLAVAFCLISPFYQGESKECRRQRSWIITTISALCMTVLSLPFVYELIAGGFDWTYVNKRIDSLATPTCMLFAGYLVADLLVGSFAYRDQIQTSSGWVHHFLYFLCCLFWAHKRWSAGFAVAAVMELPTFVMGIGALVPSLRTHWGFTISFLMTRIAFHVGLIYSLINPEGRFVPDGSTHWSPVIFAALAFPMHVFWGYKCVRGLNRHRRRVAAARAANDPKVEAGSLTETEVQARARKLLDGAVRRLWSTAPESWRKAYTEELARCRAEGLKGNFAPRSLVARRAITHQLSRRFLKKSDNMPRHREDVQTVKIGGRIELRVPPELQVLRGQNYVVSEFPVEREVLKSRRKRIVGQMRRHIEVARRDMVVF